MIVLADGDSARLAAGLWLVLAARVVTSIPHVRDQIAQLHGRAVDDRGLLVAGDGAALALAALAVALDRSSSPAPSPSWPSSPSNG